jgi:hypothetical protein
LVKNFKRVHARIPRVALCVLVAFWAPLASAQTSPQGGTKLDPAVAAQAPVSSAPPSAVGQEILRKAEAAYYVLQGQGLKSFRCTIQPDWSKTVSDPAKLALVGQVAYTVVIDDQGAAQVTPFLPNGAVIDSSLDQLVGGMRQAIAGFFQTWNSMVLTGLFSPQNDALLVYSSQPDGNHFSQKTADGSTEIVLTNDALMTAMSVITASSDVEIQPSFLATAKGLLMNGITSDVDHGKQKVNFQIQYQNVEGFQMPATIDCQVALPSQVVSIDFTAAAYTIVKQ